jgi:hypothetical protein
VSEYTVEAIYFVCGARRPQLKRNPLGSILMIPSDPSAPASRFAEIAVGLLVLAVSGLGLYAAARGAWAFAHGSRSASAEPLLCGLTVVIAAWFASIGLRLLFGWGQDSPLLPTFILPVLGALSTILGVWFYLQGRAFGEPLATQIQPLYVFGLGAGASFTLWWWRIHQRKVR